MIAINNNFQKLGADSLQLTPLPHSRPLLAIGHGTRNDRGRQTFLEDEHGHHHHHHGHHHHHENHDPYAKLEDYHQRIWKTP